MVKKKKKGKDIESSPKSGASTQAPQRRPHICFERIIPDAQDPERHVRRAMRTEMVAAAGRSLSADEVGFVARMALIASKRWAGGHVLRCRFLDGSAKMQNKVRTLCKEWEKHANIKIRFVTKGARRGSHFLLRGRRVMVCGRSRCAEYQLFPAASADDEFRLGPRRFRS